MIVNSKFRAVLRVVPAILGVLLALNALGYINLLYITHINSYIFIIIFIIIIIIIITKHRKFSINAGKEPLVGERIGRVWKAFELEFSGTEEERLNSSKHLANIINDRASMGDVRYNIILSIEGNLKRNILILSSSSQGKLDVEKEVLKTIISSTIKRVKIREIDDPAVAMIADAVERLSPSGRGYTPFMSFLLTSHSNGSQHYGGKRMLLGRMLDSPTEKYVYLYEDDIIGHIGVFGSTGSGKSTTLSIISTRAWRYLDLNVVILDWSGEYSRLLSRMGATYREFDPLDNASVNPLTLLGKSDGLDIVVDVISKALDLSEPQSYMLMKILESRQVSNISELEHYVNSYSEDSKWDREVKRGLLRKLGILTRGSARIAFKNQSLPEFTGITVIRLDSIRNTMARTAYVMTLLAYSFALMSNNDGNHGTLFVIDEAHNVFKKSSDLGFMDQLIAESRKYEMYIAIATQSPSLISNSVLLNTNTKIIHALRSARDKNVIADTLSLSQDAYSRLDKLYRGEALVQAPSLPEPVFISIEVDEPFADDASKTLIS